MLFSERYARMWTMDSSVREEAPGLSEHALQCIWHEQAFSSHALATHEGAPLRILSPGWWNHQEGPDFKGAQIEFNGRTRTGDVEVHLEHAGWQAHGHHRDPRYENVILHVVLEAEAPASTPMTSKGRPVAALLLRRYIDGNGPEGWESFLAESRKRDRGHAPGQCSTFAEHGSAEAIRSTIQLAGEWRVLNKSRTIRDRMEQAGADQAIYEEFMYACGFSPFKHHFRAIARHLPYERVRQLALLDPLLLEAALLQIGGLLPATLDGPPAGTHYARLRTLREHQLEGLKSLPLAWQRLGVRPINLPERRLAGAALFLAHTAPQGLTATLEQLWRESIAPQARRRQFERLFPKALGFWADHCTWTGKRMPRPSAPIGAARIRSIIGNVFVPAALALARRDRDRAREECIFAFFVALPPEQENRITRTMLPRLFGHAAAPKATFQLQQGLLQVHQDWCEPNPSCRNCSLLRYLDSFPAVSA